MGPRKPTSLGFAGACEHQSRPWDFGGGGGRRGPLSECSRWLTDATSFVTLVPRTHCFRKVGVGAAPAEGKLRFLWEPRVWEPKIGRQQSKSPQSG